MIAAKTVVDNEIVWIILTLDDKSIFRLMVMDIGHACTIYIDSPNKEILTTFVSKNHLFTRIKGA